MKLYLVYEDVYEGYGCELRTYGIFTSKEKAEKAKENIRKSKGPSKITRELWGNETPIIQEFESDEYVNKYLGGYEE